MGIHISIQRGVEDLPEWCSHQHPGDSKLVDILCEGDFDVREDSNFDHYNEQWVRPVDVDEFERCLLEKMEENRERWKLMANLLRASDENWLYFSF